MKSLDLQAIVDDIAAEIALVEDRGNVATYIPQLASISPQNFAIAITDMAGNRYYAGNAETAFSIQSITKVFTLTMALGAVGDALWNRVGREPSGSAFNSIVQLEWERGIPRNPFINAGAIVMADILLASYRPSEVIADFLRFMHTVTGDDSIVIDEKVAKSESATGHRNVSLASFMRSFGNINHPIEQSLAVYFNHCARSMNCIQLANAGRFLMSSGINPDTDFPIVSSGRARRILALMMTCGHYDGSGEFAFRVGLPGKSGVGGGILAIVPQVASIAVWSPGLNERGNSQLGTLALERLVHRTGWSAFEPQ
jgi:glutaminase